MPQGLLQLPTTGTVSGLQNNQDANAALAALATDTQSAAAPTPASTGLTSTAGVKWHDTSANLDKVRDQADSTFIVKGAFDETNKLYMPMTQGQLFPVWLRGFIDGFETGAPSGGQTLTIGAGGCVDNTNTYFLGNSSTFTKTMAAWAAGSGSGGLDTGTVAANTAYFVWAILNLATGATDYLLSTSGSSPTLPSGYTVKRGPISWFKTDGSSNIWKFQQRGDEFLYGTTIQDVNTTISTSAVLETLSVPSGFQVRARLRVGVSNPSPPVAVLITSPDESDQAAGTPSNTQTAQVSNVGNWASIDLRTNTSSQVRARASAASTTLIIGTYGFIWNRGRDS